MVKSILEGFRNLEPDQKELLVDINSPLKLSLKVLQIAYDDFGVEYLTIEAILACLEAADISIKQIKVTRALAGAQNKINRKLFDNIVKYKISLHGRRYIEDLTTNSKLSLFYVEANTPRTARKKLDELLKDIKGDVRVCDPYYGSRTFDVLELFPKSSAVLFLSGFTSEKISKLQSILSDFKKERPKTEIRIVDNVKDLHDRYILCDDSFMIIGHGIKDIGNKDSFIIKIDKTLSPDLWQQIKNNFDHRWKSATAV
jgi:hypothetical protein